MAQGLTYTQPLSQLFTKADFWHRHSWELLSYLLCLQASHPRRPAPPRLFFLGPVLIHWHLLFSSVGSEVALVLKDLINALVSMYLFLLCIWRRQSAGEEEQKLGLFIHRTKIDLLAKLKGKGPENTGKSRKHTDLHLRWNMLCKSRNSSGDLEEKAKNVPTFEQPRSKSHHNRPRLRWTHLCTQSTETQEYLG